MHCCSVEGNREAETGERRAPDGRCELYVSIADRLVRRLQLLPRGDALQLQPLHVRPQGADGDLRRHVGLGGRRRLRLGWHPTRCEGK
jgi:hypothetical protein